MKNIAKIILGSGFASFGSGVLPVVVWAHFEY